MTEKERREVLEAIARDTDAYPRDRIAAVRALEEMDRENASPSGTPLEGLYRIKGRARAHA
jgi:hypothetical protein